MKGSFRNAGNRWLKAVTGVALVAVVLLAAVPTAGAQPPEPPTSYQVTRSDCYGVLQNNYSGSDPIVESQDTGGDLGLRCQSYGLDIYENNQYAKDGGDDKAAGCADIKFFRSSTNPTWLILEWEFAGLPDGSPTDCQAPPENSSHQVAVEFDSDSDSRGDTMLTGGTSNCAVGAWTDISGIGWTGHQDTGSKANDVGGSDPGTGADCSLPLVAPPDVALPLRVSDLSDGKLYPDFSGDGNPDDGCSEKNPEGCMGGSGCDGYSVDLNPDSGDGYCRWDGGTKFRLALRRDYLGLSQCTEVPCPGKLRIRPWSDSQTSFAKDKMYEHDILDPSHLGSDRRDNLGFFEGPTAVILTAFAATASPGTLFAAGLLAVVLLAAAVAAALALVRGRRRAAS